MSTDPSTPQPLSRVGAGASAPAGAAYADFSASLEVDAPLAGPGTARAVRPFSPWMLWGYRWSILGVFLLVSALAVSGIWLLRVPQYQASAFIEVSPVIPQLLAGKSDMVPLYESYRGSQADFIRNPVVLNGVLDDAAVRETRWYRNEPASPLESLLERARLRPNLPPLDRLTQTLEAHAPKGKQLIVVSMKTPTPGEAKLIVDKVLEHYVRFTNERASSSENELMGKLRKEIGDREIELRGLEETTAQLRHNLGTGAPEDLVRERALMILRLEATIEGLKTDLQVAQRTLAAVPARNAEDAAPPGPDAAGEAAAVVGEELPAATQATTQPGQGLRYALDPRWQQLNDRLTAARSEAERREARFGESDPRLVDLRRLRDDAEAQLRAWEAQLDQLGPSRPLDSGARAMGETVEQMTVRLELLTRQLEEERSKAQVFFSEAEKLAQKTAARMKTEEMRQQLERRLEEMRMNREVAGLVRTFPATEPSEPQDDKREKFTIAAVIGALGLSVGLAFLRIRLSPTVDRAVEIAQPLQGAFLGYLPLERDARAVGPEPSAACLESVRVIRTALLTRMGGGRGAIVQITSATLGSGKSTLAALLARSLAQSGHRVLLVDTDMRRPSVAAHFAIDAQPGLREVLADGEAVGITRLADVAGLSVLPAGTAARYEDRELMANGVFSSLLERWRTEYDFILLDSAPLLGLADAAILAGRADGTILVVRERHCRRSAVLEALTLLRATGGRLLGTVFVGSAGRESYGYGYGYGSEPGASAPPVSPPAPSAAAPADDVARSG